MLLLSPTDVEFYIHEGYGYEDDEAIHAVYTQYREKQIPLDGLHIDVDFQVEYRRLGELHPMMIFC